MTHAPNREPQGPWRVGQKAVIGRRTLVIIEKVTPAGRARIGDRTFEQSGIERSSTYKWRSDRLEALTPEIEAEIDLSARYARAFYNGKKALEGVDHWFLQKLNKHRSAPAIEDVEKAERLTAAINAVIGDQA